ncbi:TPA: hypothetical protein IAC10_11825 [Candidatus Scatousia excrementigallinarum]|mgnify:CR=1 FL=1|uniref:Uncharacterized protein n=1 Tax=Candidatus Scatousia excrementigallinarum TaxID=2840935 RepID=A0A9D1JNQ1_9BACT|nr:hypothetical protein [Candidatus Scatousia excrementigallinarum]
MAYRVDGIESEDELKKAQAAAQAQGASVPNYNEWQQILKDLNEAGVESTGSYAGDKAKLKEIETAVENFIKEAQTEQIAQERQKETQQVKETSESDKDQQIKATVANATSSMIMADYMKYYHLLS